MPRTIFGPIPLQQYPHYGDHTNAAAGKTAGQFCAMNTGVGIWASTIYKLVSVDESKYKAPRLTNLTRTRSGDVPEFAPVCGIGGRGLWLQISRCSSQVTNLPFVNLVKLLWNRLQGISVCRMLGEDFGRAVVLCRNGISSDFGYGLGLVNNLCCPPCLLAYIA